MRSKSSRASLTAVESPQATRRDQPILAFGAREQDAALLERLADRRDLEARRRIRSRWSRAWASVRLESGGELAVRRLDPPARKDQRARGEVDLVMPHDHEDFQADRPVAQKHDGRGRARDGFSLIGGRQGSL